MFSSIGFGEVFTIGVVALIVFGPHRLPDMARKIGGYVRELRSAALDIRKGLDAEVKLLRDPLEAVKEDLTKPVTDVKKSLTEATEAVKKSTKSATDAVDKAVSEVKRSGSVQWIGAEPKTGVSPDEAWDGVSDSVPDSIADAPTEVADSESDTEAQQDES